MQERSPEVFVVSSANAGEFKECIGYVRKKGIWDILSPVRAKIGLFGLVAVAASALLLFVPIMAVIVMACLGHFEPETPQTRNSSSTDLKTSEPWTTTSTTPHSESKIRTTLYFHRHGVRWYSNV